MCVFEFIFSIAPNASPFLTLPPITHGKNEIFCISLGDNPAEHWLRYMCTKIILHYSSNHSTDKSGRFSEGGKGDVQKKLMRFFLSYTSRGRGPLSSTVITCELNCDCCFAWLSLFLCFNCVTKPLSEKQRKLRLPQH